MFLLPTKPAWLSTLWLQLIYYQFIPGTVSRIYLPHHKNQLWLTILILSVEKSSSVETPFYRHKSDQPKERYLETDSIKDIVKVNMLSVISPRSIWEFKQSWNIPYSCSVSCTKGSNWRNKSDWDDSQWMSLSQVSLVPGGGITQSMWCVVTDFLNNPMQHKYRDDYWEYIHTHIYIYYIYILAIRRVFPAADLHDIPFVILTYGSLALKAAQTS